MAISKESKRVISVKVQELENARRSLNKEHANALLKVDKFQNRIEKLNALIAKYKKDVI